ncbi:MAG TPA: VWA domain-containing protein, partial [Pyrinomonadaceae bacterium]
MFYGDSPARRPSRRTPHGRLIYAALALALSVCGLAKATRAQSLSRELDTPGNAEIIIRNRNGRVTVEADDAQGKKVSLKATSPGAPLSEADVTSALRGSTLEISVRERREQDRVDLQLRVPARSRVKVESEGGAVDVLGNLELAQVRTGTGTIHADVPLDALSFNFLWQASRPRFLSDPELPKVREKAGGQFVISGSIGDKKAAKEERVRLDFTTLRGVVLLNVDPSMVPPDLRERPLTEAAKAIVSSGNRDLIDAIRKVSPRLFGDYARTLPPPKTEPKLIASGRVPVTGTRVAPQLMRVNASVTDRAGRAIGGLKARDFTVFENGEERKVTEVAPSNEPFNLVLLLDVSGSVEDHINFIRKAARDFLKTASPQDRIAIISFRDDIQVISDFTTDRRLLSQRLEDIDAGGATALYDALAYTFVHTLKELRGERTAVVVLSDGDDNRSFVPFPALVEATIE